MNMRWLICSLLTATLLATCLAADTLPDLDGTWSGDWMPKGGTPDQMTVQLTREDHGMLTGKFVSPARMDCTVSSYNNKTRTIALEATDQKSRKHYKLRGTVKGTEIIGTADVGDIEGEVRLVKWTYVGSSLR